LADDVVLVAVNVQVNVKVNVNEWRAENETPPAPNGAEGD
jgi:hypothetical protein